MINNKTSERTRLISIIILAVILVAFILSFDAIKASLYNLWPSNFGQHAQIDLIHLTVEFLQVALSAAAISSILGFALGLFVFSEYGQSFDYVVSEFSALLYSIPSIAIIMIALNIIGIGKWTGIIAIIIQGILPVVSATYSGISSIDKFLVEVAHGLGMTSWQVLTKVQLPNALPIIISGIRTSVVMCISTATLAYQAGAGGLGQLIFTGFATYDFVAIFTGTIPICLIAILADQLFRYIENVYAI